MQLNKKKQKTTASDTMNSLIGMIFSSISKAPAGVLGNAEEIIRHASLCTFESFFQKYKD